MNTTMQSTKASSRRARLVRYILIGIVTVVTIAGLLTWGVVADTNSRHEDNVDGQYRDRLVNTRIEEAEKLTQGGIERQGGYGWSERRNQVSFDIRLGACDGVEAYVHVGSPRPQKLEATSPLTVVAPAARKYEPDAYVPVTAENFYPLVANSALAHCISGDSRFVDMNVPE